jgi:hypothetical protein
METNQNDRQRPKAMNGQQIEMMIQQHDGIKWPCLCGESRAKESDLLCAACWGKIPEAKRKGFGRLDRCTEEHALAAEQILRIAKRNLPENK